MKKKLILLLTIFANISITYSQWSLTGNAGTNPPTNFLGTTDAKKLIFKVNNVQAGSLDYDNTKGNASFGYQALLSNTGTWNTSVGYQALYSNTSATNNDAYGNGSMFSNTTGNANSAFGNNALYHNTTGYNNFAFGLYTLYNNTTGKYNIATAVSLYNNTSGSYNTAYGFKALYANTITNNLTAIGYETLFSNTNGLANTGTGYQALYSNTGGNDNTANGYQALYTMNDGEWNTATGSSALFSTTSGSSNTATGFSALYSNTNGDQNTANGRYALTNNTSGLQNTAIGEEALYTNTTGNGNTALGLAADVNANNYSNTTVIGNLASGTASNQVRIGNSSVTSIGGYANWSNISDGRFKKNVKENVPGLAFIKQLRPITYNLDVASINKFLRPSPPKTKDGKTILPLPNELSAVTQKELVVHTGFVAQEVETIAKKMNYDFSGVDAAKSEKDLYSLRYADFVVPLVKAVQELSNTNDSLKAIVDTLQSQINEIRQQINNLKAGNISTILDDIPLLKQNAPNPFNSNTIISYYTPINTKSAQIIITDINGQNLKNIAITGKGSGQITITAGTLPAGNYVYTLIVDGRKVDSRQMILIK